MEDPARAKKTGLLSLPAMKRFSIVMGPQLGVLALGP
jgi:hypothetical protein